MLTEEIQNFNAIKMLFVQMLVYFLILHFYMTKSFSKGFISSHVLMSFKW